MEVEESTGRSQVILKMSSEDQTVDHTNMLTGNDHNTNLYVMSEDMHHKNTQTLKIVIKGSMTVYRHRTRHVHLRSHEL